MNELRQHQKPNISTESSSMSARIHEKLKAFYGDTLYLRLLELIPAAAILASFVCHACLTCEEPREGLFLNRLMCLSSCRPIKNAFFFSMDLKKK